MDVTITSPHRDSYAKLVEDLKDTISGYIEEDAVTPSEFVGALRQALSECLEWHDTRGTLLRDAQSLLGAYSALPAPSDRQFLQEKYQAGAWKGDD